METIEQLENRLREVAKELFLKKWVGLTNRHWNELSKINIKVPKEEFNKKKVTLELTDEQLEQIKNIIK